MNQYDTVDKIVDREISMMDSGNINYLKSITKDRVFVFHHGVGTYIRNKYKFWESNPLTEKWRTDPTSHKIVNGVDCSEDHPDAVSMRVLQGIWEAAQKMP
jgi:hypothetical protein